MSLEAFGLKNLRCLTDTGLVPIRRITVLVGRNSSGKSTFLRAFPLLRQSVETRRNSPILWLHDRYVDFGSLVDAANHNQAEPKVTFQFRIRMPEEAGVAIGEKSVDITMTLAGQETPYVDSYKIRLDDNSIRWDLNAQGTVTGIMANGRVMRLEHELSLGGRSHLLPTLHTLTKSNVTYQQAPTTLNPESFNYQTNADQEFIPPLEALLAPFFHGKTSGEHVKHCAYNVSLGTPKEMLHRLASLSTLKTFQQSIEMLDVESIEFKLFAAATAAYLSPYIVEAADLILARFMSRIAYLKPLRVNPKRTYPKQNFAVDEVDPDGENLPMFLHSLTPEEQQSFASFTQQALGFETSINTTKLHTEILIKEGSAKRFVNLVDVGFGFSEVLPLAAVLWATCVRPAMHQRPPAPLVAIEQPELHLHPAAQARLARMFAETVVRSKGSKVLVETHSESLINGLGKLIHEGVLAPDDVQIVLFDKDDDTGESLVSLAGYRENGMLHDWPYGFLSAVGERRVPQVVE